MNRLIDTPGVIWWIRRDLRLNDNPALAAAMATGCPVLPVFILDDHLMKQVRNRRQHFLVSGLQQLKQRLQEIGSDLVVRQGNPTIEIPRLYQETGAVQVFAEEDYSPYARERDLIVRKAVPLKLVTGLTVFHPAIVRKDDGAPYTVFTPFSRKWRSLPEINLAVNPGGRFDDRAKSMLSVPIPAVEPLEGFPAGEEEAENRLQQFLQTRLEKYANQRDRMDLDATSKLSPYLRFGMISASRLTTKIRTILHEFPGMIGAQAWLNELIWREFYQSVLFNFPNVSNESFNPKFRRMKWRDAPQDLNAWKEGLTGYPVVDAGMRELISTGWMHNRVRMIAASFLTKDLLINWQEGEHWFMDQLVDGDLASNNGGWQWAAGTGTDAAPYFRIFNPVLQGKKFNPKEDYIRRWIPELRNVPDKWIHDPWLMPDSIQTASGALIGKSYPRPIVDHLLAKERALLTYKSCL
jgi:deoxyribodipyrimidine photo-lyase